MSGRRRGAKVKAKRGEANRGEERRREAKRGEGEAKARLRRGEDR